MYPKGSKWDSKSYNTKGNNISHWFLMQSKITYFHQKYMKLFYEKIKCVLKTLSQLHYEWQILYWFFLNLDEYNDK